MELDIIKSFMRPFHRKFITPAHTQPHTLYHAEKLPNNTLSLKLNEKYENG